MTDPAAVDTVHEHCDSVQVIVTTYNAEQGETETYAKGAGNWWARRGSAQAWLRMDESRDLAGAIAEKREE